VLLTEDMQDGRIIEGLRLMSPFAATNSEAIDALLPGCQSAPASGIVVDMNNKRGLYA
jgi:hypothetical protein